MMFLSFTFIFNFFDLNYYQIDKLIGSANKLLSEFFPDYPALSIANNTKDSQIPPSSYQTFLKENRNISGFIISPFDNKYSYR